MRIKKKKHMLEKQIASPPTPLSGRRTNKVASTNTSAITEHADILSKREHERARMFTFRLYLRQTERQTPPPIPSNIHHRNTPSSYTGDHVLVEVKSHKTFDNWLSSWVMTSTLKRSTDDAYRQNKSHYNVLNVKLLYWNDRKETM